MPTPVATLLRGHAARVLLLALAVLVLCGDLVRHPGWVFYSPNSDLLSQHVPRKLFLVRSFQSTGELPRWSPYEFCGAPFLHDIQVGAFYPPHAPLYLLGQDAIPAALSWLIVLHLLLAGATMYGYACAEGLSPPAALIAGLGVLLHGKWLLHLFLAGHYILIGLAWLPLLLWLLGAALRRRCAARTLAAGLVLALLFLGTQPQWSFYALLFAAAWTLLDAGARGLARGTLVLAGALAVALALSAVQWLPVAEAAALSRRGGGVIGGPGASGALYTLAALLGPGWQHPRGLFTWELRGDLGILWSALAAAAPLLGGSRERRRFALLLALLVFAVFGGYLLQPLPGFQLFRFPSRMLVLAGPPLGWLAAAAADAILRGALADARRRRAALAALGGVVVVAGLGTWLEAGLAARLRPDYPVHPYWSVLPLLLAGLLAVLARNAPPARLARFALPALLGAELFFMARPLVATRDPAEVYFESASVRFLAAAAGASRVADRDILPDRTSPLGPIHPLRLDLHSTWGYNPLDVVWYKELFEFISDIDRPFDPAPRYPRGSIRNRGLFDLLGARWLLQPGDPRFLRLDEPPTDPAHGWRAAFVDPAPRAYVLNGPGLRRVPPHTVWENLTALPRAFVVPSAAAAPGRRERLAALRQTDFRARVLLDGLEGDPPAAAGTFRPARIREHFPNRVAIDLQGEGPGWLVLSDVWFPGWEARVAGQPRRVYRANHAFRAVRIEAGERDVEFRFAPRSLALGRTLSLGALAALALAALGMVLARRGRRA